MNKLRKMSLIVVIPIVLGIAMMVIGNFADIDTMYHIGVWILTAGIPLTMFVLVVVGLILMITGKIDLSDDKKRVSDKKQDEQSEWEEVEDDECDNADERGNTDEPYDSVIQKPQSVKQDDESEWVEVDDEESDDDTASEHEREYAASSSINTSHSRRNNENNVDMIRQSANKYRNAPKKDKVLGWMFFGFLMTDFALIIVFFMLDVFVGAIVCFCIFGGTILIALLVTVLRQKISMGLGISKKKKRDALDGTVTSCDVASTTKVNNRITKVVYQVIIVDGDGEYNAYSESPYEKGDKVKFCKIGKRLVSIVDEELEDDEPLDN